MHTVLVVLLFEALTYIFAQTTHMVHLKSFEINTSLSNDVIIIKMAFIGFFSFYSKVIRVFVFGNVLGIMVKYQILFPLSRRALYFALNW